MALLRKGGNVRLSDYFGAINSKPLVFGLGWDITGGKDIDLDASVMMVTAEMQVRGV